LLEGGENGGVLLTRNAKWLFALVLLVVAATVEAAPSIGSADAKVVALAVSPTSYTESSAIDEVKLLISTNNPALSHIAADLLKPPAELTNQTALPSGTKHLPAVPAALFMALTGFLCVTIVRDRKFWLTAITFLLWAGQTGFAALPQAALYLIERRQFSRYSQQQYRSSALQERTSRLRSDLEGIEYTGLLHHLEGIPNTSTSLHCISMQDKKKSEISVTQNALNTVFPHVIQAINCLSYEVRQFICFSPAFIFNSIPRSPPLVLRVVNFSQKGVLCAAPFKLKIR
jgi:hypothetical protein